MIDNKYQSLKTKTLLYVEDDVVLQQNIVKILEKFFDTILVAGNGDEAYTLYIENQNRIDVLVTDINMPKTDGITLVRYIREYNRGLPVIVISAYTNTDYLIDSIDLNIIKYITKPFTTKKVIAFLDKLLEFFSLETHLYLGKDIELNYQNAELITKEETIKLTKKENIFLKLLANHATVTYDMMYEYIWDYDKSPSADAIKSFVKKLQKKLPEGLCRNQNGVGYYLNKS
ncbi:MAG: response regulator transcription factor [Epsilonproteobacteria bacterium]|nr:response regulator transcription factor [Campylobacterota bacterium]